MSLVIFENQDLKPFNTFGISCFASRFTEIEHEGQFYELLPILKQSKDYLFMGGGSNILFTGNFDGLIVHVVNRGIKILTDDGDIVKVEVAAGENWNGFVEWCLQQGLGGLENLSLIPGTVGSSPIQNIGAYGVEMKDCFDSLQAFDLENGEIVRFTRSDCRFAYRNSIFKQELKGKVLIWKLVFNLSRKHVLNLDYGAIRAELESMSVTAPTIDDVSHAVCRIRRSKLPDPEITGNAGSFFKNPSVSTHHVHELQKQYPSLPAYNQPDGNVKLAAGWLIEQCGWKGFRQGDAGVHPAQALVLVNYGNATGAEILELSGRIQDSVHAAFGVRLETEVNIL